MKKTKLLDQKVQTLGTISSRALRFLGYRFQKEISDICIRDLLTITTQVWYQYNDFSVSGDKTKRKLIELGFEYEDGIFLQENTRRQTVECVMTANLMSRQCAEMCVETALKLGWIKPFWEETMIL